MDAIVIEGLTKTFWSGWPGRPSVTVLDGLTLSIEQGQIYGFLGPNGSGKTTTLKILLGLMHATTGRVEVLGKPAGNVMVRKRIGFLPESPYFYDYLTAEEFLNFYGHLAGLDRVELNKRVTHLLEIVGLVDARTRQLRKFSKGMLQRIGLAQALIHDPELVILDEPMSGLDPVGRKQVRDLILGLRDQGKTVFFSTHIIPDVEMICDRVGVLAKGKLLATGRVEELVTRGHTQSVEIVCQGIKADGIPAITSAATRVLQRGQHSLIMLPGPDRLEETLAVIRAQGGTLISVTPQKGSLEELFLEQADGRPKFEASASAEV
ncbi:MAG: ABC transporter ATP-binding protein [Nitrospirota bacterium]|nr:ABC transporter ATP-binding protein [Nitrospirota bacterium]